MKDLILTILPFILGVVVTVAKKYFDLFAKIKQDNVFIQEAVKIVQAVEQELGNGNGGTKLKTAVARLIIQYSDLTEPEAYEIINKAWYIIFGSQVAPPNNNSTNTPNTPPPGTPAVS